MVTVPHTMQCCARSDLAQCESSLSLIIIWQIPTTLDCILVVYPPHFTAHSRETQNPMDPPPLVEPRYEYISAVLLRCLHLPQITVPLVRPNQFPDPECCNIITFSERRIIEPPGAFG